MRQVLEKSAKTFHQIGHFIANQLPHGMANKLFVLICGIGLFFSISLGYAVTAISGNLLYQDTKNMLDNQVKQTVNVFNQYMEIMKNTVMTASRQSSIQSMIEGNYPDYKAYTLNRDAYAYLKNIHEFYGWINIYVIVKDERYIMSSTPADVVSDYDVKGVTESPWYRKIDGSVESTFILSDFVPPASSNEEQFAYALKIRNVYNWDTKGYIIATINKNILNELLRGTNFEKNGFLVIMTEAQEIAYSSDYAALGNYETSFADHIKRLTLGDNASFGNDSEYYYSSWKSQASGWNFIAFADKNYAKAHIFRFQIMMLVICATTFLLLIMLARVSAKAYIKPIKRFIHFIHDIEKKEFAGQIDLKLDDELGELVGSFNAMIVSVRQNQVLRKKAEIDALQKQINPHFLFNTFQSIKALAQQNDSRGVIVMLEKLSDMFHYNMNRSNDSLTQISDEIAHMRNYLDIQRVRFGPRMEVFYDIDDAISQYWMLRFIFQPIVENSVTHGMEQMKGRFRLDVCGRFDGDDILFIMRDSGVGIPEDKLSKIEAYIYDKEGTIKNNDFGIGLKNIHERLNLLHGEGYGLSLASVVGEYTEIRIRIAKMRNGEAEKDDNHFAC